MDDRDQWFAVWITVLFLLSIWDSLQMRWLHKRIAALESQMKRDEEAKETTDG